MPYIPQDRRRSADIDPHTVGELNFAITSLLDNYILEGGGLCYDSINDCIGVLECAKLELYRRLAAPYETIKMAQNGDVYKTQVPGFTRAVGDI